MMKGSGWSSRGRSEASSGSRREFLESFYESGVLFNPEKGDIGELIDNRVTERSPGFRKIGATWRLV